MCAQLGVPAGTYSEDCLYLNVWTPPGTRADANLPVMVFIHGGSLEFGTGGFDGSRVVAHPDEPVVLVTINYRLNGFGYLALGPLSAHDERGVSGNYGTTDQIQALKVRPLSLLLPAEPSAACALTRQPPCDGGDDDSG